MCPGGGREYCTFVGRRAASTWPHASQRRRKWSAVAQRTAVRRRRARYRCLATLKTSPGALRPPHLKLPVVNHRASTPSCSNQNPQSGGRALSNRPPDPITRPSDRPTARPLDRRSIRSPNLRGTGNHSLGDLPPRWWPPSENETSKWKN